MKIFLLRILTIGLLLSLWACDKNKPDQNPYLENIGFSREINLDLPEYSSLKFANNSIIVHNVGIKGVIVFNTGNSFLAWEASDPNHYPSDCSTMTPNQFTCECSCEGNKYSLYDGQKISGDGNYSLKPYHIYQNGNILTISN